MKTSWTFVVAILLLFVVNLSRQGLERVEAADIQLTPEGTIQAFRAELYRGDVEAAVEYVSHDQREQYRKVLSSLEKGVVQNLADGLAKAKRQNDLLDQARPNRARFWFMSRLSDGGQARFLIILERDTKGRWWIVSF